MLVTRAAELTGVGSVGVRQLHVSRSKEQAIEDFTPFDTRERRSAFVARQTDVSGSASHVGRSIFCPNFCFRDETQRIEAHRLRAAREMLALATPQRAARSPVQRRVGRRLSQSRAQLLQPFPCQDRNGDISIGRTRLRVGAKDQPVAFKLYISRLISSGPYLVRGNVNVVNDGLTIERICPSVGHHRPKEIRLLLIAYRRKIEWLRSNILDDQRHHTAVATVSDEPARPLPENVRGLPSRHDGLPKTDETPRSVQRALRRCGGHRKSDKK